MTAGRSSQTPSNSWWTRLRIAVDIGVVIADLNPLLSEPVRLGVLFGAQALFHNVWIAGLSFAGMTMILDLLGMLGAVDLLDKRQTSGLIDKVRNTIKKRGFKRLIDSDTTFTTDIVTALIIGTPFTLIFKQSRSPARTRRMNLRLGLVLVISTSLAAGLQGAAVVAGLWHPNALTIALAVIAVASLFVVERWLRRR